ncbi:MAG TPA: hypothetical protein GXX48_11255 [Ochrobactrum intermedium]|uniref:Uncharacterized protein n=1 Tax=Brucella intermedia TaxID=94625 RepID=A0A7V6TZR9_9HYPH|nr:hypothetical protein [Brucella intermedia]HHV68205.1 hypothetical protein [Brucella intermedia]
MLDWQDIYTGADIGQALESGCGVNRPAPLRQATHAGFDQQFAMIGIKFADPFIVEILPREKAIAR